MPFLPHRRIHGRLYPPILSRDDEDRVFLRRHVAVFIGDRYLQRVSTWRLFTQRQFHVFDFVTGLALLFVRDSQFFSLCRFATGTGVKYCSPVPVCLWM